MDSFWNEGADEWGDDDDGFGNSIDNEEGDDDDIVQANAHHMMFLVDCAPECFGTEVPDPDFDDDTCNAVAWSMKAILEATVSKLRTVTTQKIGKRDGIGVLLYNTKLRKPMEFDDEQPAGNREQAGKPVEEEDDDDDEDEEDSSPFGSTGVMSTTVHQILPLEQPGVSTVKRLKSTQEDTFTGECEFDLKAEFCATENESMANPSLQLALEASVKAFSQASCVKQRPAKKEIPDKKQIWILTSQDNPIVEDNVRNIIKESASNVRDNNIEVLVWPVVKDMESFDVDAMYSDIIGATMPCEDTNTCEDFVSCVEILSKSTRRAFSLPLLFPNWMETQEKPNLMLDFYTLIRQVERPSRVPVHQETGRALSKIVQHVTKHTGQILGEQRHFGAKERDEAWKVRERKFFEFAGVKVPVSETDKLNIKKQGSANQEFPSLILLGFKNTEVPFYHSMRSSYFCYPNNVDVIGSESAFVHLHASMLKKKVIGIGEFLPPRSRVARLVAIKAIPQQLDNDGDLVRPAGLLVTYLPFEEEVRAIAPDRAAEALDNGSEDIASSELVDAAEKMIAKRTLAAEFSQNFENAYIGRLWDYVQHVALDEGMKANKEYDTEVDPEKVRKALGDQIDAFLALLPEDVKPEPKERKRKAVDGEEIDWKQAYLNGELAQFRNVDLKKKLQAMGESGTGKKEVLVERLSAALAAEYQPVMDTEAVVKMEE